MKVVITSSEVFACYSRACAPPPVGKGGSGKGGRKGALARAAASKMVAGTKIKIAADKAAAKSYGTKTSKGGPSASKQSAESKARAARGKSKANDWASGKQKGLGKSANPRSEATLPLTEKYGSRRRGK